jgi:hypothetical protein
MMSIDEVGGWGKKEMTEVEFLDIIFITAVMNLVICFRADIHVLS